MMRSLSIALIVATLLCRVPLDAATLAGVTLPDSVNIAGSTLLLNGMGVRSRRLFKVYVAGLYLERKSTDAQAIAAADAPKRLVLHFVRSVSADQVRQAVLENFDAASRQAFRAELDALTGALGPLRDGDELAFIYIPGTGTRVTVRNSDGATIAGLAFARTLFLVWLGDKPPSTDLRSALLGR